MAFAPFCLVPSKVDRIYAACEAINAQFFISGGYGAVTSGVGAHGVQSTIEQVPQ